MSLDYHKSEILTLKQAGKPLQEIARLLNRTYQENVNVNALDRQIQKWLDTESEPQTQASDDRYISIKEASDTFGFSPEAIRSRYRRGKLRSKIDARGRRVVSYDDLEHYRSDFEGPSLDVRGDKAIVNGPITPTSDATDADEILRERGLNPDEWEIERLRTGKWGPPGFEQEQIRLEVRKNKPTDIIWPARADGYRFEQPNIKHEKEKYTVVCVGDQQAPFHDQHLHSCFLQFLKDVRPEQGVLLGDTIDLGDISRHRRNPDKKSAVQECINSGYNILLDIREASTETHWRKLAGNHDERLRNLFIDKLLDFYGTTRAEIEGAPESPVHAVEFLLRLDELGIEYIDPLGPYDQAQINITPYLAARHGWLAKQGSGVTALKTLDALGYSIIVGHTHRQAIVRKSIHDIEGKIKNIVGVEAGCMCEIGLGYSVAEDWTQGFVTVSVHSDGMFNIDLATYYEGVLYWRDKQYS